MLPGRNKRRPSWATPRPVPAAPPLSTGQALKDPSGEQTQAKTTGEGNFWWREIVVGLLAGLLSGGAVFFLQMNLDNQRVDEAMRLENLRFVRDRSGADPQTRPFGYMDLSGMNLSGLELDRSNFRAAILKDVRLDNAHFNGKSTDLVDASLENATMTFASFKEAKMHGAVLVNARAYASNFSNAELYGARLQGASLKHVNMSGVAFEGSDLEGATFESVDLTGAKAVDLTGVHVVSICYDETTSFVRPYSPPPSLPPGSCATALNLRLTLQMTDDQVDE